MQRLISLIVVIPACLCISGYTWAQEVQARPRQIVGKVERYDLELPELLPTPPSQVVVWENWIAPDPPSEFLILHLVFSQKAPAPWSLSIFDKVGNEVMTINSDEIETKELPFDLWTEKIPGSRATLKLYGDPRGLKFKVDKYVRSVPKITVENIVGRDDREDIITYKGTDLYNWGRGVALIEILEDQLYTCTGFLVSQNLLLTNEHCLNDKTKRIAALFDFETGNLRRPLEISVKSIEGKVYNQDFAILRLKQGLPGRKLVLVDDAVTLGESLIIIQHPGGEKKQVTKIDCSVAGVPPAIYFTHTCDTLSGSSGSPVFNQKGAVIGIHEWGFAESNDKVNKAIPMKEIIAELRSSYPSLLAEMERR